MKNIYGARISLNIKYQMKMKGLNQKELAERLGISPTTICLWFKNLEEKASTNLETIIRIAEVLEVDISIFFARN